MNIKVEFTEQEARVALTFFEIALKSAGDQAVDAYVVLRNKVKMAAEYAERQAQNEEIEKSKKEMQEQAKE